MAATEQVNRHLDGTARLQELSAHTNVWAIGAIMFELLTHEGVAYYLNDDKWTINEVFKDIPNLRNPKYSGALTELIRLCLMPNPWDRPSIEELELRIGTRSRSILDAYAANPSLQQKDRLYYRGSEINQMPPGNWHYWNPVVKDVPHPSDPTDSQEPKNPFTDDIVYPPFPSTELSSFEEKYAEYLAGIGNGSHENGHKVPTARTGDGIGKPVVISDSSTPRGNDKKNPIMISSSHEENSIDKRAKRDRRHQNKELGGKEGDGSDGRNLSNVSRTGQHSVGSEESSDNSDDSETRRRMAIKKLPGS